MRGVDKNAESAAREINLFHLHCSMALWATHYIGMRLLRIVSYVSYAIATTFCTYIQDRYMYTLGI